MDEKYAKEKNLIQLPMFFFGKKRPFPNTVSTVWSDEDGKYELHCNCSLGVPGSLEQDTYAATMRIWVKRGMPLEGIEVTYSEIAEELNLDPRSWNQKIKKSLEKLGQARYRLKKSFVKVDEDGNRKIDTHFSLFDTVILFTKDQSVKKQKNHKSRLVFPDIIKENLEAKFYQFLDMKLYKAIPGGLARRLYEYLAKKKYQSKEGRLVISEELICRWLPIKDNHSSNRRKRLEKIANSLIEQGFLSHYEFCKERKLCKYIFAENNKKPPIIKSTAKKLVPTEQKKPKKKKTSNNQEKFIEIFDWISSIPYFHEKKRKELAKLPMEQMISVYPNIKKEYEKNLQKGKHLRPSWVYNKFMEYVDIQEEVTTKSNNQSDQSGQMDLYDFIEDDANLEILYGLLKKDTRSNREKILRYTEKFGYEFVKNNILYANENTNKNYSAYLGKALEANWGSAWAEEKAENAAQQEDIVKQIEEEEKRAEEERQKALRKKAELQEQRAKFKQMVIVTPKMIRDILREKAEAAVSQTMPGRGLNVKIEYSKLLLQAFNGDIETFSDEVVGSLDFIKEIAEL